MDDLFPYQDVWEQTLSNVQEELGRSIQTEEFIPALRSMIFLTLTLEEIQFFYSSSAHGEFWIRDSKVNRIRIAPDTLKDKPRGFNMILTLADQNEPPQNVFTSESFYGINAVQKLRELVNRLRELNKEQTGFEGQRLS